MLENVMDGLTPNVIIAGLGLLGSGLTVFFGMKIALAEHRKDIDYLMVEVRLMKSIDKDLEKEVHNHHISDLHIQPGTIARIEHQIDEMQKKDDIAHSKIEAKIDKLFERIYANTNK
jgi:hypothetical protein